MKAILLVHDDIDLIVALGNHLNRGGNIVIPKTSGEAALSTIREGANIDLVILGHTITDDDRSFLVRLKQLVPSVPFMVIATGAQAASFLN